MDEKQDPTIIIKGQRHRITINANGERLINDMSIDDFIKTLTPDDLQNLAFLGMRTTKEMKIGAQAFLSAIEKSKEKN